VSSEIEKDQCGEADILDENSIKLNNPPRFGGVIEKEMYHNRIHK
jgi:hypothetical protein